MKFCVFVWKCCLNPNQQFSFKYFMNSASKYFVNFCIFPKLFSKVSELQTTLVNFFVCCSWGSEEAEGGGGVKKGGGVTPGGHGRTGEDRVWATETRRGREKGARGGGGKVRIWLVNLSFYVDWAFTFLLKPFFWKSIGQCKVKINLINGWNICYIP